MIILRYKTFSEKSEILGSKYRTSTDEEMEERREKRSKKSFKDSGRGYGRAVLLGGPIPGVVGTALGTSDADSDYHEGYSGDEMVKRAGQRGAKRGAAAGALAGLAIQIGYDATAKKLLGMKGPKANYIITPALAAGWGALGGYAGSRKNVRKRLEKTRGSNNADD